MNARLALRFESRNGQTLMRVEAQEPPWRVIRAFQNQRGSALVHLHNVSGGVLAGDRLSLDISVGPGASAQITSTGATRLYRHRPGAADSEQHVSINVDEGAVLEYLPDPVIPFAGARHRQSTTVQLATGATLFWWECLAPGRQAMGEQFAFDRLEVRTRVHSQARPVWFEDYRLEPSVRTLASAARLGAFTHVVNFVAIQASRPMGDLRQLESELSEMSQIEPGPAGAIWGASTLCADGVIVRGLSTSGLYLPAALARYWGVARRFLTGEEAVPPRKLK